MLQHSFRLIALLSLLLACHHLGTAQESIHPWDVFELQLQAEAPLDNPYVDALPENGERYLTVEFSGTEGEAQGQKLLVPGFWDGGQTWKVRFAPLAAGTWSYRSRSKDPAM